MSTYYITNSRLNVDPHNISKIKLNVNLQCYNNWTLYWLNKLLIKGRRLNGEQLLLLKSKETRQFLIAMCLFNHVGKMQSIWIK